ncbi:unnamed protein product [Pleuronectes platessa]|uniref:Uncharacterized protein n=1 Tax=Pleuronectes platessa TaxID=8262 RepID=A0A9N7VGP4_PLEPL|nr:unnamed protein product [Pleuronectes platessa]
MVSEDVQPSSNSLLHTGRSAAPPKLWSDERRRAASIDSERGVVERASGLVRGRGAEPVVCLPDAGLPARRGAKGQRGTDGGQREEGGRQVVAVASWLHRNPWPLSAQENKSHVEEPLCGITDSRLTPQISRGRPRAPARQHNPSSAPSREQPLIPDPAAPCKENRVHSCNERCK